MINETNKINYYFIILANIPCALLQIVSITNENMKVSIKK